MKRKLVLMRHAEAANLGASDASRALTERGRQQAVGNGVWLAEQGIVLTDVLLSPAVRVQESWAALSAQLPSAPTPVIEPAMYGGEPETVLDLIHSVPSAAESLLVIGHNPTIWTLSQLLQDDAGVANAVQASASGFPASALALYEVDQPWAELAAARLTNFVVAGREE